MTTHVATYEALQQQVEEIARAVTADFRLAVAAASNPLLALRELGFELAPRVAEIVEERARHSRRRREELREARRQFEEAVGRRVDLSSPEQLGQVLNDELGLGVPPQALAPLPFRRPRPGRPQQRQPEQQQAEQQQIEQQLDPLAAYAEAHPAVAPLLAYRALQASAPPLADEDLYRRLRSGDVLPPLTELRVRRAGSDEVLATARRR